jgi:hypothetical protein
MTRTAGWSVGGVAEVHQKDEGKLASAAVRVSVRWVRCNSISPPTRRVQECGGGTLLSK